MATMLDSTDREPASDLVAGLKAIEEAFPKYDKAEKFYEGTQPEVFNNRKIAALLAPSAGQFRLNFAATPCDVVADSLSISAVVAVVSGENTGDDAETNEEATARLETEVWEDNGLGQAMPSYILKTGMYGDGYLFVWPGEEEGTVEVHWNSPKSARMIYADERPTTPLYYVKRWKEDETNGSIWRANVYYENRVIRFSAAKDGKGDSKAKWAPFADDEGDSEITHENGFPIYHLRNAVPYGCPEHERGYGPQAAIDKLAVTLVETVEAAGFPSRYALTEGDALIDGGIDNPDFDDDADDVATSTDGTDRKDSSRYRVGPGELALMPGVTETGQYDSANPDSILKPIAFFVRVLAQLTTTPMHYFDTEWMGGGDAPSGESLRVADAPRVKKADKRKDMYGPALEDAFTNALEMIGVAGVRADIRWAATSSIDDVDGWDVLSKKNEQGVPQSQTLREAGYDGDLVDSWLDSDDEALSLARRVAVLDQIGDAMQKISSGVAAGVLSAENAAALVEGVLSAALGETVTLEPDEEKSEPAPAPIPGETPPQLAPFADEMTGDGNADTE